MTGDTRCHGLQPRLQRRTSCPEFRKHRSVDRVLAAPVTSPQHLLKAVGILAEIMQYPGKTRKTCQDLVAGTGRPGQLACNP
jgi:hypothetical protein